MKLWILFAIFTVVFGLAVTFDKVGLIPDFITQLKDIIGWLMTLGLVSGVYFVNGKVNVDKTPSDMKRIKKLSRGVIRL